jgi:hypothetical protein
MTEKSKTEMWQRQAEILRKAQWLVRDQLRITHAAFMAEDKFGIFRHMVEIHNEIGQFCL